MIFQKIFLSRHVILLPNFIFSDYDTAVLQHRRLTSSHWLHAKRGRKHKWLHNFAVFKTQMAVYCHYLTLLSILLFIWKTTALEYSDFEGLKYIILDKSSSNNGNFYSSLFDSKGNVDHDKLKAHSRERRSTPEQYALPSNTTRHGFPSATEYEFKGDNHTVAFLHWSGTKSQVSFS